MCPVCHTRAVTVGEPLSACPVCKHIWQTGLKITAVYDANYVHSRYDAYPTTEAMSYLRLGFVKAFARNGRILDVGYGNGSFLKKAAKAGFSAFGNDVHGADYGIQEVPLDEAANGSWDVVTFFDSLEHFSDLALPRTLAQRARTIVISIPCRPEEFPSRLEWRHYRPGEHLHYFSRYSLELFFASHHAVASRSDVEDTIRGKLPSGEQNILTMAFIAT